MLTNGGTPFTEEGFAAVIADLRRIFLLVGGGSNDLNNASSDVTQDSTSAGENANNAFKLRNVNIATTAPTDGQLLSYSKVRAQWEGVPLSGVTVISTGTTSLLAANNLSDLTNATTAQNNLSLGTANGPTFAKLTLTSGASVGADLSVSSGTVLNAGLRLPPTIKSSNYGALASDCLIIVSGTTTITMPSASSNSGREFLVGAYPGASVTVAPAGSDTIRGATGVTLLAGKVHSFYSDGINMWLEGRSA